MMNYFLKKKSEFVKRNEEMKVKENIGPMEQERVFFQSKNRQQREQAQADKWVKLEEAEQKLKTKKKSTK